VRWLGSGRDTLVFVFNHGREEAAVSLGIPAAANATNIVTGRPVELARDGERSAMRGRIGARDVWVVRARLR